MKIILAAMAAVIVILVVALSAALMDKTDVAVQEVPVRIAPSQTQHQQDVERLRREAHENRQRQPQNQPYRAPRVVEEWRQEKDAGRLQRDEKRRIERTKEALEKENKERTDRRGLLGVLNKTQIPMGLRVGQMYTEVGQQFLSNFFRHH